MSCSHKFVDSNVCLKCGWTPPARDPLGHAYRQRCASVNWAAVPSADVEVLWRLMMLACRASRGSCWCGTHTTELSGPSSKVQDGATYSAVNTGSNPVGSTAPGGSAPTPSHATPGGALTGRHERNLARWWEDARRASKLWKRLAKKYRSRAAFEAERMQQKLDHYERITGVRFE